MGSDSNGKYFTFYDNASGKLPYSSYGANPEKKLYYNPTANVIEGGSNTSYFTDYTEGYYRVTQIRKSKSL